MLSFKQFLAAKVASTPFVIILAMEPGHYLEQFNKADTRLMNKTTKEALHGYYARRVMPRGKWPLLCFVILRIRMKETAYDHMQEWINANLVESIYGEDRLIVVENCSFEGSFHVFI